MDTGRIVLGSTALLLILGAGYWQLLPSERRSAGAVPDTSIREIAAKADEKAAVPEKPAAGPAMSFGDKRPLETAAEKPVAPPATAPASPATLPKFRDERLATAPADGKAEPAAPPSFRDERLTTAPSGGPADPAAPPSFRDERLTTAPSGSTADPAASPSFRDERLTTAPSSGTADPAASPSFRDERLTTAPSGATADPAASPSFRDERLTTTPAGQPAGTETPSFRDQRLAGPTVGTPAAEGVPSFRDERLTTAAGGAAGTAPPAAGPSFRDQRLTEAAAGGPTFRDQRLAETPVSPSFRDTRVAGTPGFSDERPLQSPSFRDKRGIDAPTFSDERPVAATPSFRDERGVGAPSFRDDRSLGVPDESDAPPARVALAPTLKIDPSKCTPPEISGEPVDGGRMNLRAHAECQANQTVRIIYGGADLIRTLDSSGNLDFTLDCFAGAGTPVEVRFADGTKKSIPVAAYELDKVSKIAVIWRAAVNLDLHVFEYAARQGQQGHLWARNPSSLSAARTLVRAEHRGHGFISSIDSEENAGDKVEVYTFLHDDQQTSGAVGLALDYETRGETPSGATCGNGALAEVDFHVVVLPRGGNPARQSGVLTRVDCGTKLSADMRFSQSTLPSLRIRK